MPCDAAHHRTFMIASGNDLIVARRIQEQLAQPCPVEAQLPT